MSSFNSESGALQFKREILTAELMTELHPLLDAHYQEIARYKDIPLSPDVAKYTKAEELGFVRMFVIRDGGKPVGYGCYFLETNAHYSTSLQAKQDVLFLSAEYRKGGIGQRFIAWCDEQLRLDGVQAVYHHVKLKHNFGPMLEKLGYEPIDVIYGRRL
jgi:GNAT superfamily N-acetyltransferase